MLTEDDHRHLLRCVELAEEALRSGSDPFGSVLVSAQGEVLFEGHNEEASGDATRHPEFDIARWAASNMSLEDRARSTVYTSGEHCPMCAAAHGWVGLGRIVYALSSADLGAWRSEFGLGAGPVSNLPIQAVVPGATVDGPDPELRNKLKELHRQAASRPPR
jgi:tRNA(Arg) A34 adenosine deaminase TadA